MCGRGGWCITNENTALSNLSLLVREMKTSMGTVKNEHRPIFTSRVSRPHVFSTMIHSHGSSMSGENHKTIVPHQILNPEYDPKSPKLKVSYIHSGSSSGSIASSSSQCQNSELSERSNSMYSMQSLPQRKPYRPRAERNGDAPSSNSSSSAIVHDGENEFDDPSHRLTIMELESILIREKSKLKKIQLEAEAVWFLKVDNKTLETIF